VKGRITKEGLLEILRGSEYRKQHCPRTVNATEHTFWHCGDWCTLFGEPVDVPSGLVMLDICDNELRFFDELIDERCEK